MDKKLGKKKKGSVMILLAILLPSLLGFTSMAIDVGNIYFVHNKMQTAADAAALAAATSVNTITPGNNSSASTLAQQIATKNNFTNGSNNTVVTVSIPPGNPYGHSSSYANNSNYARVQISQPVALFFGGFVGISTMAVSTNAVAGPGSSAPVVVSLATSGSGLNIQGSSSITAVGGTINVNSTSSSAIVLTGTSTITASQVNDVGGFSGSTNYVHGTLNQNYSTPASDPFASISTPSAPYTCNYTNYNAGGVTVATLSPGVYCGGINIGASAKVTFNPGLYIIYGGGFSVSGAATATGSGVTFFNTGTASGTYKYGGITVAGSAAVTLSAPTSGTYTGMLFMQAPQNTVAASLSGATNSFYEGNLYFPGAAITISGSSSLAQPVGITAAQSINITGASSITFTNSYGGGSSVSSSGIVLYE